MRPKAGPLQPCKKYLPVGSRALEVGCGDGWLAERIPPYEWHGVEPDLVLRRRVQSKGMWADCGSAESRKPPLPGRVI
jgi:hypothetical protein